MAFFNDDQTLQIVIRAKDEASKVFTELESKVKRTGQGLKNAGKSLTVGLTAPITALGVASVKAAGDFEKSLGDLSTLVGAGTESMAKFETGLKEVMKTVPKSGDELGAAAYQIVSAGISDASQALNVLEQSGKLAVAGLGQTSEAADLMTSAINAFGLEADKANEIADVIFKTVKNGKTTVAELAQSFGMVAPVAAEMGVSFEELQAATAALTTSGLKTSVAQQQIRAAMASLLKPTKEASDLFEKLGVKSMKQLIAESGGMVQAFNRLKEASAGNEEQLAKAAGSVEGLGAILALTGNQADAFNATMADITEGSNAMDAAFEAQKATFNALWQEMKNKLNVAMIELGTAIMPAVKDLMEKVAVAAGKLADWFGKLSPKGQKFVLVGAALLAALGPVLFILGQLVLAAPAIGAAFTIMTGPIGIVIAIIGGLIFIGLKLIKNWDTIKWAAGQVWDWVLDKISFVVDGIKAAFDFFIEFLKAWVNLHVTILKTALALIVGIVATFLDWLFPNWQENLTKMIEVWREAWDAFSNKVSEIIEVISSVVGGAFQSLVTAISGFLNKIKEIWLVVWSAIADFFVDLWQPVKDAFASVVDFIIDKIQKAIDMYNRLKALLNKPIQAVSSAGASVGNFFSNALSRGKSILGFEHGGTVPGPRGTPQPIIAHGQEQIIPAGKGSNGGGNTFSVVINNPKFTNEDDERRMRRMLDEYFRPLMVNHKISA
jgi:TP901 family phage tail tape measure protein